jgi:hypothetical protein
MRAAAIAEELRHRKSAQAFEVGDAGIWKNVLDIFVKQFVVAHGDIPSCLAVDANNCDAGLARGSFVADHDGRTRAGG